MEHAQTVTHEACSTEVGTSAAMVQSDRVEEADPCALVERVLPQIDILTNTPIKFSGSLEDLLELVARLPIGAVVDLQGAVVQCSCKKGRCGKLAVDDLYPHPESPCSTTLPVLSSSAHSSDCTEVAPDCAACNVLSPQLVVSQELTLYACSPAEDEGRCTAARTEPCLASKPGAFMTSCCRSDVVKLPVVESVSEGSQDCETRPEVTDEFGSCPEGLSCPVDGLLRTRSPSALVSAESNKISSLQYSVNLPTWPVRWLLDGCPAPWDTKSFYLTASGVTVRNGTLGMPKESYLLIDNSADLIFDEVHVTGEGAPVMERRACRPLALLQKSSATFTHCSIQGCIHGSGLAVVNGSKAKLFHTTVSGNGASGLSVLGTGSEVFANYCSFSHNGQDGVQVESPAEAMLLNCDCRFNRMVGVCITGAATTAHVQACRILGNGAHAVAVQASTLLGKGNEIQGGSNGLLVLKGGKVTLDSCAFRDMANGTNIRDASEVVLRGCSMQRCHVGALAQGRGAKLKLEHCSIEHIESEAIRVLGGATLKVLGGTVMNSGNIGIEVMHPKSYAIVQDAELGNHASCAVAASAMGTAVVLDSSVYGSGNAGVRATDSGSSVSVRRCNLMCNQVIGAFVNKGAKIQLRGCALSSNGSSGAEVRDRCSQLHAVNTTFTQNGKVGVYVHSSGTAILEESSVCDNTGCSVLVGGRSHDIPGGIFIVDEKVQMSGEGRTRNQGRICKNTMIGNMPMSSTSSA